MNSDKEGFVIQSFDDAVNQKRKLKSTNKLFSIITCLIIVSMTMFVLTTFVLTYSLIGLGFEGYLFNSMFYFLIALLILVYVFFSDLNYYKIKIIDDVIDIKILRTVNCFSSIKDCIFLSSKMFVGYSFVNRLFTFNKTLIIKTKTDKAEIIIKHFNLSFLSKKEERRIGRFLHRIIVKNKLEKDFSFSKN